jgi:hypothetical protein
MPGVLASRIKAGYRLGYRTLAALSQDHGAYLTHGGAIVPKRGKLPDENDEILLRIEAPSGAYFDFPSRVVRQMPGEGFMVAFEPASASSRLALDELVGSADFRAAMESEAPVEGELKRVALLSPDLAREAAASPGPSAPPSARLDEEENTDPGADEPGTDPGLDEPSTDPRFAAGAALDEIEGEESTLDALPTPTLSAAIPSPPPADDAPFPTPASGESYAVYVVRYPSLLDFVQVADGFLSTARLEVPYPQDPAAVGALAQLRIGLPGKNDFEMYAVVDAVRPDAVVLRVNPEDPSFLAAGTFPRTSAGQKRLATEQPEHRGPIHVTRFEEQRGADDDSTMPLRRRINRMGMEEKINLALSGEREERMALANDGNKAIHHYLLRNAKISLDEIALMARMPGLNPDVLVKIGENPAYTQNPQIVRHLVFNPKTPTKLSLRLLDRLPRGDLQIIAKRNMHRALVAAAQKKLGMK